MTIDATNSTETADVLVQKALHQHESGNHRLRKEGKDPLPLPTIYVTVPGSWEDNEAMAQKLINQGIKAENITYAG